MSIKNLLIATSNPGKFNEISNFLNKNRQIPFFAYIEAVNQNFVNGRIAPMP